ncbi:MAG: peptide ABC transporter substrate-binding protein [Vicinamibacterales bacterium]
MNPHPRAARRVERSARLWSALLAAILAAGCSTPAADSPYFGKTVPPDGQRLRYISGSEPESLDPQLTTGQPEARIIVAFFEGLTEYDPKTGQPIPALAERWEPNADNSVFTFHLRDARWSDGAPITADDFVYSLRRGLSPALAARAAYLAYDVAYAQAFNEGGVFVRDAATGQFVRDPADPQWRLVLPGDPEERSRRLEDASLAQARGGTIVPVTGEDVGIDAPDARTVRFRLRRPIPFLPGLVAHQFFRAVPRQVIEKYGDRWVDPGHLVTSGAYLLASWKPYDAIVARRNPAYWDAERVTLDEITFYPVEDATTMMNLYKSGEVEGTFNHTVPASWIDQVRRFRDYQDEPEASAEFYLFNTKRPPMNDLRVRRAFNMAVDKSALARFRRIAKAMTSAVPPGIFPEYHPPEGDPFDPESARALLVQAGFRDARGDYDPARFPVDSVELVYNTSESNRSNAEFIQAQWKQNLGLTIPLRNMEFKTFLQVRGDLDYRGIARAGWVGDYMDPFTFLSLYVTEGGDNGTGWADPEYTRMLNEANRQPDPARRYAMLAEAEALLLRNQPILPLYSSSTSWLKKPYVKGMYPNPITIHPWKYVYIEHDPSKWD